MNCPVCTIAGLDDKISECPNCKSKLDAFYQIDSINKKLKNQNYFIIALAVILVIVVIGWGASIIMQPEVKPVVKIEKEDNLAMKSLTEENESLKVNIQSLEEKIEEIELNENVLEKEEVVKDVLDKENDSVEQTHIVKEGETLYKIAKKELGSGLLYKKIAKDNDIANPNKLLIGTELKISK